MGLISLPIMLKYGYSVRHTTGVIAASGTITQLVPPSLVLVVLADQLGKSVGDMYKGAIGPSLIQIALFFAWVFNPQHRPFPMSPCPAAGSAHAQGRALARICIRGWCPAAPEFPRARTIFMGPGNAPEPPMGWW